MKTLLFLSFLLIAPPAEATLVLNFAGTVTEISDPLSQVSAPIAVGDSITGSLSYDPSTAQGGGGSYRFSGMLMAADLYVLIHGDRDITVWHDHSSSSVAVGVTNDAGADGQLDSLTVLATAPFFPAGMPSVQATSTLALSEDGPGDPLSGDSLPLSVDLAQFFASADHSLTWTYRSGSCFVTAELSNPAAVPEPRALLLLLLYPVSVMLRIMSRSLMAINCFPLCMKV